MTTAAVDVAIVGGGPAGAVTAALLAQAGREVLVLERAPAWRWRACGVFTSPATRPILRNLGLAEIEIDRLARRVPAARVETRTGTAIRLSYGAASGGAPAMGFDRGALDARLLDLARAAGAEVRRGIAVSSVGLATAGGATTNRVGLADGSRLEARVVVGADGLRSLVARAAGVGRPPPLGPRMALTFHVPDPRGAAAHDTRMVVIDDGYVGLAPVPGNRVNVGIVLGRRWAEPLRVDGAREVARAILGDMPPDDDGSRPPPDVLDSVEGVAPLGHRVARRAGPGWLLAGDAAGFLDPFTGEGLHRALESAELAASVILDQLSRDAGRQPLDLGAYDRAMAARFGAKDVVSRLVQLFLGRPRLFEYAARRLASRERLRETLGLVIGDLLPARRALDPRFLAAVLAP